MSGGWQADWTVNDDGALAMLAFARGVGTVRTMNGLSLYRRPPAGESSLSGRRLTPDGLAAGAAVLEEVIAELEARARIRAYRSAIIEALGFIEANDPDRLIAPKLAELEQRVGGRRPWDRLLGTLGPVAARSRAGFCDRFARRPPRPARDAENREVIASKRCSSPLVSIIIPTYNRARLVCRAAESVLRQSHHNFELLVIDDGSTDDTVSRLQALDDKRLRVVHQAANGGVAAARNRGIAEARGEFVAFLDSDDAWKAGKLEAQVAALQAAPAHVGFCYALSEFIRPDGRADVVGTPVQGQVFEAMLLRVVVHGGASSLLFRREVLETIGGFDESLPAIEDWDLFQRAARLFEMVTVPRVMVRVHEDDPGERRSLRFRANMRAREMLFFRNRHALRRAKLEHLYLLESARRELSEDSGDAWAGRRLVLQALAARPLSGGTWPWLAYMAAPAAVRRALRESDPRRARLIQERRSGRQASTF